mgnify:CR=1 FL=1
MSEELKCPYCEGTASIAYHRTGNNLLYCHDCKKTFSEVGAKIMKQDARIAEQEAENRELKIASVKPESTNRTRSGVVRRWRPSATGFGKLWRRLRSGICLHVPRKD